MSASHRTDACDRGRGGRRAGSQWGGAHLGTPVGSGRQVRAGPSRDGDGACRPGRMRLRSRDQSLSRPVGRGSDAVHRARMLSTSRRLWGAHRSARGAAQQREDEGRRGGAVLDAELGVDLLQVLVDGPRAQPRISPRRGWTCPWRSSRAPQLARRQPVAIGTGSGGRSSAPPGSGATGTRRRRTARPRRAANGSLAGSDRWWCRAGTSVRPARAAGEPDVQVSGSTELWRHPASPGLARLRRAPQHAPRSSTAIR